MEKKNRTNNYPKSKNKFIIGGLLITLVMIGTIIGIYQLDQQQKNKTAIEAAEKLKNQINTTNERAFKDYAQPIEYGTKMAVKTNDLALENLTNLLINQELLYENTIIKITMDDLEITSDQISYMVIGEHKITAELILDTATISHDWLINVVDTKLPEITGANDRTIMVGDKIDLKNDIKATDVIDGDLEVTIDGTLNNNKVGVYQLIAKTADKNGNEVAVNFKVTVKAKTTTKSSSSSSSASTKVSSSGSSSSTSTTSAKSKREAQAKTEAKRVTGNIIKSGMSDEQKAKAILNYLHYNVDLQDDQSTEAYKTNFGNEAYGALILKKAACSGFAKAVLLMCDYSGLKCKHINAGKWTHQWNTVYINGKWVVLDAQGGYFGEPVYPYQ